VIDLVGHRPGLSLESYEREEENERLEERTWRREPAEEQSVFVASRNARG
jgi:hypothetical protein